MEVNSENVDFACGAIVFILHNFLNIYCLLGDGKKR